MRNKQVAKLSEINRNHSGESVQNNLVFHLKIQFDFKKGKSVVKPYRTNTVCCGTIGQGKADRSETTGHQGGVIFEQKIVSMLYDNIALGPQFQNLTLFVLPFPAQQASHNSNCNLKLNKTNFLTRFLKSAIGGNVFFYLCKS